VPGSAHETTGDSGHREPWPDTTHLALRSSNTHPGAENTKRKVSIIDHQLTNKNGLSGPKQKLHKASGIILKMFTTQLDNVQKLS